MSFPYGCLQWWAVEGGRVVMWERWVGSEVARWEGTEVAKWEGSEVARWEGSELARWKRLENGEAERWEVPGFIQGLETR